MNKKEKLGGASQKFKLKFLLGIVFEFLEKVLYKGIEKKLDMKKVATILTQKIENEDRLRGLNINDILTGGKRN